MLKFTWAHEEQEHEHLGLQRWHGDGAVRMYRADPTRGVMLLERLHADRDLTGVDDVEACAITAGLYRRLHVPAMPQLRPLSSLHRPVDRRPDALARRGPDPAAADRAGAPPRCVPSWPTQRLTAPDPRRPALRERAVSRSRAVAGDRSEADVRRPPLRGRAAAVEPLGRGRRDGETSRGAVRRRFHTVVDTAELDEDRARDWVVVRMLHNAMWCVQDHPGGLDAEGQQHLTTCVSIAKAVQD